MNKEKRLFTRITLPFPGTLTVPPAAPRPIEAFIDISVSGCRIATSSAGMVKERCQLAIPLGGQADQPAGEVVVEGVIVRVSDGTTAIKFTSIDPDSLFHLKNLIRFNAADSETVDQEMQNNPGIL